MSALRFPIRFWLVLTVWFAVACVAFRNGTEFWLGVVATLTVLAMALALQRALSKYCVRRWFWIGFLVGSVGYLLVSFGPRVDRWREGFMKQQTLVAEEALRHNGVAVGNASGPRAMPASRLLGLVRDSLLASPNQGDRQSTAALYVDLIVTEHLAYQAIGHLTLSWIAALGSGFLLALLMGFRRATKDVKSRKRAADQFATKSAEV